MIPFQNFGNMGEVTVSNVIVEYQQEGDCMESDAFQALTLETCDGGGGPFIRIKTGGDGLSPYWSINNADELVKIINDFQERVGNEYFSNK